MSDKENEVVVRLPEEVREKIMTPGESGKEAGREVIKDTLAKVQSENPGKEVSVVLTKD